MDMVFLPEHPSNMIIRFAFRTCRWICCVSQSIGKTHEPCFFWWQRPYTLEDNLRASLRGGHFLWKGAYARFRGKLAFAKCFRERSCFQLLKRELPHLHGHIFRFIGTSSSSWAHLPLHGHIFPFMATYSPSWPHIPLHWHIFLFIGTFSSSSAHLPLHWHLFPFIGTSSPSWVHLPFQDRWRGALAGHGLLPRELSPGYARGPERKMPNQIHAALAYSKLARRNLKD